LRNRLSAIGFALVVGAAAVGAQGRRGGPPPGKPRNGTIERVTVRERDVVVYLPPSDASDAMRRFPAVYLVAERPLENLKMPEAADRLAAAQGFSEPIVALVEASNVSTDGERFLEDLVAYMDAHYRTMTARISRGIGGQGAGGATAFRVAVKHPDVFSSLYLSNATIADAPAAIDDAAAVNLQRYYSIAIDVGTKDSQLASNRQLHDVMTRRHIPHYYEEYDGGSVDKLTERIATRVVPFFSRNLTAPANPTSPAVQ